MSQPLHEPLLKWITQGELMRAQVFILLSDRGTIRVVLVTMKSLLSALIPG